VFHTLIALGGWTLFVWWWWIVFRRVSRAEVELTLAFIGLSLVIIVLLTVIWAIHNVRIHRIRGPRTHVRGVDPDYTRDGVGRAVRFPQVPEVCRTAALVRIGIQNGSKVYAPVAPPARLASSRSAPSPPAGGAPR
jgi:hypothetical protein